MNYIYIAQEQMECSYCGEKIQKGEEFIIEDSKVKHTECAGL